MTKCLMFVYYSCKINEKSKPAFFNRRRLSGIFPKSQPSPPEGTGNIFSSPSAPRYDSSSRTVEFPSPYRSFSFLVADRADILNIYVSRHRITYPPYLPSARGCSWRWWFGWAEEADGGGKGMTGLNDRIVEGSWRDRLERRVGGARAPRRKWAGATPDCRRPSHTILEAIPPPRQSTVGIRIVNNP